MLLIEHDMDIVFSFADRISVLVNGALFVEGPPEEVARDPRVKAVYLGEEAPMPELLAIEQLTRRLRRGRGAVGSVSLSIAEGQSLALLGRNGMGKTTLVNSIVGVTRYLRRHDPARRARHHAAARRPARACRRRLGAAGAQHLQVAHGGGKPHRRRAPGPWTTAKVFAMFPRLAERRRNLGNQLSGGEQQMLAVGRALILNPRIILLDEPLEGLAPIIVEELLAALQAHHPRGRPVGHFGRAERQEDPRRHRPRRRSSSAAASCIRPHSAALATDAAVLEKYLGVPHSDRLKRGKSRSSS